MLAVISSFLLLITYTSKHYRIFVNVSNSLPDKVFLVELGEGSPIIGDYVLFSVGDNGGYDDATPMTKIIGGVSGDVVTEHKGWFYINGNASVKAKEKSLKGERLVKGPVGIIPVGQYFVYGTHKDSFDSRYQRIGWIQDEDIIGIAHPIW